MFIFKALEAFSFIAPVLVAEYFNNFAIAYSAYLTYYVMHELKIQLYWKRIKCRAMSSLPW